MADLGEHAGADEACADLARSTDPERWLCALFAPPERRGSVLALLALNQELGRIAEVTREPMTALIRLQWWRDALGDDPPAQAIGHPIVRSVRRAVERGLVDPAGLRALIDAREQELEAPPAARVVSMLEESRAIAGRLQRLTAAALGATDPAILDEAERIGTAWGVVGAIRATRHRALRNRISLPIAGGGVTAADLAAGRISPAVTEATRAALHAARELLPGRRPRAGAAAPALLLRLPTLDYLRMIERAGCDPSRAAELRRRADLPARLWWAWWRSR